MNLEQNQVVDNGNSINSGSDAVEVCNWEGQGYVALTVWPRGFANEFTVYVVPADEPLRVDLLQQKIDRRRSAQPGDGYDARWMTRQEVAQHIYDSRRQDGWIYLITLDEDGFKDAIRL